MRRAPNRRRLYLDHLDRGTFRRGERFQPLAQFEGDGMAGTRAIAARGEIDLQLAKFRRRAQIIMPDQAVEVERGGGAGIDLDRGHLRQLPGDAARR